MMNSEIDECLPDVTVYGLHHPLLSLSDRDLEALSLAVAGHRGRAVTYRAVRVHPDDLFPRLVAPEIVLAGMHGLV